MIPPDPEESDLLRRWAEEDHLQTDAPRRNWPLLIAAALAAGLVVLVVVVVTITGADDEAPAPPPQEPPEEPEEPDPGPFTTVPPGPDTGLSVVDQGVTVTDDRFDASQREGTFAVVIENPHAEWLARGVQIDVQFLDEAGATVGSQSGFVEVLLPGQRAAVAALFFDAPTVAVTDLTVVTDVAQWSESGPVAGSFEIRDPITEAAEASGIRTRLLLRSTYADELADVEVTAIYRNEFGAIMGGTNALVGALQPGVDAPVEIALPGVIAIEQIAFTELYPTATFEPPTED